MLTGFSVASKDLSLSLVPLETFIKSGGRPLFASYMLSYANLLFNRLLEALTDVGDNPPLAI